MKEYPLNKTNHYASNKTYFYFIGSMLLLYIVYFFVNLELYRENFYQYINIAFDLDQAWFIDALARPSDAWLYNTAVAETPLWIKHPLLYLLRFPAQLLQLAGIEQDLSAIMVTVAFISATPLLFYYCLRLCQLDSLVSAILTVAFSFSASFLVNAMVLDSYSIAQFWILATVALFLKQMAAGKPQHLWLKAFIYVGLVGTSSYLILLALLAEALLFAHQHQQLGSKTYFYSLLHLAMAFTLIFGLGFILVYANTLVTLISDPVSVLKKTLWAVSRPGEKEGIIKIIETFLVYSVFSPSFSAISIEPNLTMLDYRQFDGTLLSYSGLLLLIVSYLLAVSKLNQPIIQLALLWLMINFSFHLFYQDRSSLFLYTGHIIPLCFLALSVGVGKLKRFAMLGAMVLALLTVATNIDTFDTLNQSLILNAAQPLTVAN